jgi:acid phosphatase family membrane protein YuiD
VLYEIITNQVLVAPLCAWAVAQLLKVFTTLVKEKRLDLRYLVISGGMPSAHSALVSALATSVAIVQGLGSVAFGITAILALVVMYDAAGIRQSVGLQSVVLNRIVKELRSRRPIAELERDLREFIGHTPFQVIAGAALGIIVAWLWIIITT